MKKGILYHIYGTASQGKTTVIKKIYEKIKHKYHDVEVVEELILSDIRCIIVVNGVKIGIESQGDPNSRLFSSLEYFKKSRCDMIICASRTRGKTIQAVKSLEKEYEIKSFHKRSEHSLESRAAADNRFITMIVDTLDNDLTKLWK
jgi:hypothetical protein